MSYHRSIRGAHSLLWLPYASSSSECFDLEYSTSSPTSSAVEGSKMASFPLRREEPWLFIGAIV